MFENEEGKWRNLGIVFAEQFILRYLSLKRWLFIGNGHVHYGNIYNLILRLMLENFRKSKLGCKSVVGNDERKFQM